MCNKKGKNPPISIPIESIQNLSHKLNVAKCRAIKLDKKWLFLSIAIDMRCTFHINVTDFCFVIASSTLQCFFFPFFSCFAAIDDNDFLLGSCEHYRIIKMNVVKILVLNSILLGHRWWKSLFDTTIKHDLQLLY